jgi:hypothetical protein
MMRIAVIASLAAASFAALPNDQGVIAPDDAKAQELKELLALDSFNVTSSDAEQNRMHAICDMEYRLSKKFSSPTLGINLIDAGAPQLPFNPFTMPLAAVNAHIAMLNKQKEYLEAQSKAFGGSSSATTASPSTELLTIAAGAAAGTCNIDPAAPYACITARQATMGTKVAFTTSQEMPAAYKLVFTFTGMVGTTKTNLLTADGALTASAAAVGVISDDGGTATTADDGNAKYSDGTDYTRTQAATEDGGFKQIHMDDNSAVPSEYAALAGQAHTLKNKLTTFSMTIGPLAKALKQIKGGSLKLGAGVYTWASRSVAAGLKEQVEGAVLDASGTVLSTSTQTVPM